VSFSKAPVSLYQNRKDIGHWVGDPLLKPNPYVTLDDIIVETFPVREERSRGRNGIEENEDKNPVTCMQCVFSFYEGC
jgi:hypothetical protein